MSLSIRDAGGNDLQETPPAEITLNTATKNARVGIYCAITENDPELSFQLVGADVDWNDGSQPAHFPQSGSENETASPLVVNTAKTLGLGTYAIKVNGHNNRAPTPDTVSATFIVNVKPFTVATERAARVFGPVLPRDDGNPSPQSWLFDSGNDLAILVSSVKMLLVTAKGERVMQPGYGTNLRRILFELNIDAIESIIQQEITQALVQFEPRVRVRNLTVNRDPNHRNVSVQATFLSNLAAQPFEVNLQFDQ